MSTAVLDQVEALQAQAEYNRDAAWLELVTQFVDGDLPEADEVARIFRETGKGRKELEQDGKLLQEYRWLEMELATIPELQRRVDELGGQLSTALKEREEAEAALKRAQVNVSQIDSAHNVAGLSLRDAQRAEQRMNEPRFSLLKGGEPLTVRGHELTEQIADVEGKLKAVASGIHAAERNLSRHEAELEAVDHTDLSTEDKNVQRTRIQASIQGTTNVLNRHGDEEHSLQRDLRVLRKELAAEKIQP